MRESQTAVAEPRVRRIDRPDGTTLVVDVGVGPDVSVDLVGGTAIVVVESGDETLQRELDLPEGTAEAFNNNGVVSIEVSR